MWQATHKAYPRPSTLSIIIIVVTIAINTAIRIEIDLAVHCIACTAPNFGYVVVISGLALAQDKYHQLLLCRSLLQSKVMHSSQQL
ncbi:hypothetical protein V1525DRAFT_410661 [Lipomyces kononenkoae]|uniref:Uncharacterized protein n=1 Tax=Lipomyces kononenkoae TaxID=34357 RepID=A0ACC3SU65_LIPKO